MSKKKANPTKRKTFKEAVEATSDAASCFQSGLRALGNNSNKITVKNTSDLEGSLDIDTCTLSLYPQDNRWDYALSYKGVVFFVEVHTAKTIKVTEVEKKLRWLKDWLHSKAPEINKLKAKQPYHWVQTSNFDILRTSPQYKRLAQSGLLPKKTLDCDSLM